MLYFICILCHSGAFSWHFMIPKTSHYITEFFQSNVDDLTKRKLLCFRCMHNWLRLLSLSIEVAIKVAVSMEIQNADFMLSRKTCQMAGTYFYCVFFESIQWVKILGYASVIYVLQKRTIATVKKRYQTSKWNVHSENFSSK